MYALCSAEGSVLAHLASIHFYGSRLRVPTPEVRMNKLAGKSGENL